MNTGARVGFATAIMVALCLSPWPAAAAFFLVSGTEVGPCSGGF